jgi:hypothetical protein
MDQEEKFNKGLIRIFTIAINKTGDAKLYPIMNSMEVVCRNEPTLLVEKLGKLLWDYRDDFKNGVSDGLYNLDITTHPIVIEFGKFKDDIITAINGIKKLFDSIKDSDKDRKNLFALFFNLCLYYAQYIKNKDEEKQSS